MDRIDNEEIGKFDERIIDGNGGDDILEIGLGGKLKWRGGKEKEMWEKEYMWKRIIERKIEDEMEEIGKGWGWMCKKSGIEDEGIEEDKKGWEEKEEEEGKEIKIDDEGKDERRIIDIERKRSKRKRKEIEIGKNGGGERKDEDIGELIDECIKIEERIEIERKERMERKEIMEDELKKSIRNKERIVVMMILLIMIR